MIRCKSNSRVYVGSTKKFSKRKARHFRELEKGNHHNILLQRSYAKYGRENFEWSVLEYLEADQKELHEAETRWMDEYDVFNRSAGFNIAPARGGDLLTNNPNRSEIIYKITKSMKDRVAKMSEAERKEKWGQAGESNGMFGKTHTAEARKNISEKNMGKPGSMLGRKHTKESKLKMSENAKKLVGDMNPFYGKTHSDETKQKISEANKGAIAVNRRKISIDGIHYDSLKSASEKLGIKLTTIWHRLKSPNVKYSAYISLV